MKYILNELMAKYYDDLEKIVNECAIKCVGGSKASLSFPNGKVTIELK